MQIITGDALEALRQLPDGCCSTCVTSPPYYGLRDYGTDGQIGLEQNPEEYVEKLVEVFREVRRVLRDDGTLWLNIGDSYATRSGNNPPTNTRNSCGHTAKKVPSGYKYKDLIGIPWLLAFALRADGWYLRADIIWHKPNAMPEAVKDRPTKAHEYIFLLSKRSAYYYDAEAVKEAAAGFGPDDHRRKRGNARTFRGGSAYTHDQAKENSARVERESHGLVQNETGKRNRRSVWTVATRPYKGAHFATFPEALARPCILAGSKPGDIVLDPFAGSGTTGAVAVKEGRDFIGIEINPTYSKMTEQRIQEAAQEGAKA